MSFSDFVDNLLYYANEFVAILIGVALVVFLWGLLKYVSAGDDSKKRTEGRNVIIWGIIGLAVMIGVWGFVNIVANTISGASSGGNFQDSSGGNFENSPGPGIPGNTSEEDEPFSCADFPNHPLCNPGQV